MSQRRKPLIELRGRYPQRLARMLQEVGAGRKLLIQRARYVVGRLTREGFVAGRWLRGGALSNPVAYVRDVAHYELRTARAQTASGLLRSEEMNSQLEGLSSGCCEVEQPRRSRSC